PVPAHSVPERIDGGSGDPDAEQSAIAMLYHSEAVRLLVDRATAAVPAFRLTTRNAAAVVQVCRRLDGVPLAIELAAARLKVLTVEQVAARLDDRFRLLTGGSPTALRRHPTLRATLDWIYDLRTEPEQTLLRRLSVFAGGWTLEAAEAVCGDEKWKRPDSSGASTRPLFHSSIPSGDVLDLLTSLVDRSLVV